MNLSAKGAAVHWLRDIADRNRQQEAVGLFSVCSAHPQVLQAAMRHALASESMLCVESTSNQVNQFGGYTGLTPAQFAEYLHSIAQHVGFPKERILLGGDHLGPYPWRRESRQIALAKAGELVRACILAGYVKIHLDASMGCADDPVCPLPDELVAQRAAQLCSTAEHARAELPAGAPAPVYVIGTEVPVPGGEQAAGHAPEVTRVENMQRTLEVSRAAFHARGLENAWERVIGLVVQPGVEFGDTHVFDYDRRNARLLRENLPASPPLVYEAHSTDYQTPAALREMVEDHFAILKVGPWLTFAFREAVFALSRVEQEWLGHQKGTQTSGVRRALDEAMLANPVHWKAYYSGDEPGLQFARQYSYSDRCRYYWPEARVQKELERLLANLSRAEIPLTLLSQWLPKQYESVRAGVLPARPENFIEDRIQQVLRLYSAACRTVGIGSIQTGS
jgi:D-tagatose-1,6-bisphosphate aldolase subunit GatZ/KbaZ